MNYRTLLPNLKYCRLVEAPKRDYHVLEGAQHYVLFSPRNDGTGNYTIVPKKAIAFIVKKVGGARSVTVAELLDTCKGSMYFPDRFSVLNAMYALIGAKGARIAKQKGAKLFFNVWKGNV